MKLIGIGVGALAIIGLFTMVMGWKHDAEDRKAKLEVICQATRSAAANPKLACSQVAVQIKELGDSNARLKSAIASQNAAVNDLAAKSAQAQAEAAQASRNAQERARGAEATSERLRASARAGGTPSASCKASRTVEEVWK